MCTVRIWPTRGTKKQQQNMKSHQITNALCDILCGTLRGMDSDSVLFCVLCSATSFGLIAKSVLQSLHLSLSPSLICLSFFFLSLSFMLLLFFFLPFFFSFSLHISRAVHFDLLLKHLRHRTRDKHTHKHMFIHTRIHTHSGHIVHY